MSYVWIKYGPFNKACVTEGTRSLGNLTLAGSRGSGGLRLMSSSGSNGIDVARVATCDFEYE